MHKKNDKVDLSLKKILRHTFFTFALVSALLFLRWAIVDIIKPQEKSYIAKSRYVYRIIQEEASQLYKKQGYVFKSIGDENDYLCEAIKKRYPTTRGSCVISKDSPEDNFIKLKKGSITIHGLSSPPYNSDNTLVKDIFIDVNGEKGENKFGIDRAPIRIYSTGRLGGMIAPINCKKEDSEQFWVPYSPICPKDVGINFMDSKIPFAYSILQIGSKNGRSRYLSKNISYLRADCVAFGGDLTGATDYCDYRKYQWLTACYHEYRCAIELLKKHN